MSAWRKPSRTHETTSQENRPDRRRPGAIGHQPLYFVLNALDSNLAFFVTPTEIAAGKAPQGKTFRVGGMVREGSLRRDNLTVHFVITDTAKDVPVAYTGILPDLFKEGKGAVAQGKLGAGRHVRRQRSAGQAR